MKTSESKRLTETGAPRDLELAAAIRALRAERATPREITALAERLAPQFEAGPAGPVALPQFAASAKWLMSLVLAFGLGLFATLQFRQPEPQVVASAPRHRVTAPPRPLAAIAAPPAAIEPTPQVAPPAPPRVTRAKPQPKAALPPPPQATEPHADAEAELKLLGRAQRALDFEPRSALALAEEHAEAYPRGVFVQEREMLAIQALLKLRERRAALARAEEFLNHYPTSPHARHLRPLLERGE